MIAHSLFHDLKLLSQLFEKKGQSLGQNELWCAFCTDPSGFFVGELDGKIISYISMMNYNHYGSIYGSAPEP